MIYYKETIRYKGDQNPQMTSLLLYFLMNFKYVEV